MKECSNADIAPFGPAALRLAIGAVFIGAGLQKLLGIWGGAGISGTAALFRAVHLAPAYPLAVFITCLELIGGVLLVIGALTTWVASLLVVEMIVAIWKVHFVHGFFLNWRLQPGVGHGYEFNLVLIGALVCLICTGPGAMSAGGLLARRQMRERISALAKGGAEP
ncbi:MAG TPA: DoxX family protein [Candidatus Dormibacteraeota bacterium]|nr:DoxX family protein [Candidatus Dormibacteraeota bacterium]